MDPRPVVISGTLVIVSTRFFGPSNCSIQLFRTIAYAINLKYNGDQLHTLG